MNKTCSKCLDLKVPLEFGITKDSGDCFLHLCLVRKKGQHKVWRRNN